MVWSWSPLTPLITGAFLDWCWTAGHSSPGLGGTARSPRIARCAPALPEEFAESLALEPVLRAYEGCARALLGEVEGGNVIKLHRYSGKVTYLACPELDRDPDPVLALRVKVTLPALAIEVFDYARREERPRLGVGPGRLLGRLDW